MTVKITKPEINVREELNDLKKPTGIAGEAMLRAETPQEQFNLINAGRRNLLINGNFLIWQRNGTSVVDPTFGPYNYITADRWVTYYDGTYEQIQDTLPTNQIVKTLKYTSPSNGKAPNFNQPIEDGANIMSGQTVTMSWWMKASKNSTIKSRLNNTSTGTYSGSYDLTVTPVETHEVTTSWTYHTATKTLPSNMTYDHINYELFGDTADWNTNDTFQIANCQLELGKVATPFEYRSYGEELNLCLRYYEDFQPGMYGTFGTGRCMGMGGVAIISMPIYPKRTPPSVSMSNMSEAILSNYNSTGFAFYSIGTTYFFITNNQISRERNCNIAILFNKPSYVSNNDMVTLSQNYKLVGGSISSGEAKLKFDAEL